MVESRVKLRLFRIMIDSQNAKQLRKLEGR